MDLPTAHAPSTEHRFPRPRGDGPARFSSSTVTSPVSPPTRGWTHPQSVRERRLIGFPAHAGMDPTSSTPTSLRIRFPRPRGDGPELRLLELRFSMVSPPTRGWTQIREAGGGSPAGFPAHAGMDPWLQHRGSRAIGFPRPRGDGPTPTSTTTAAARVSPPTRGWTYMWGRVRITDSGFPAHAGMDLAIAGIRAFRLWFPRPRGDGPPHARPGPPLFAVSPPTRGWTVMPLTTDPRQSGFPAHAGMDHGVVFGDIGELRFPRPRGDGPRIPLQVALGAQVSPPTRGWTCNRRRDASLGGGFPAQLSMALENCAFLATENCALSGDGSRGPA